MPSWCPFLPVVVFLLANFVLYLSWPIIAGDTDLWYHLTAGRYIAQHHVIPSQSFFSFLQPPRHYVDYYWFFQVLVYHLYAWWNYPGLLLLRALLYTATLILVACYLFAGQRSLRARLYNAGVFMIAAVILQSRFLIIRPHMVSYFCVAAFIFILECYPRQAICLFPLSILWMNTHGIVYPVMGLIVVAYLIEYIVRHVTETLPAEWNVRSLLLPLLLCLVAVGLTPFGVQLPHEAFVPTHHAAEYITELKPYDFADITSFQFPTLLPTRETLVSLVFLVAFGSALAAGVRRRLRLSHLILLLGGTAVMFKHGRFLNEFVLLALPMLKTHPLMSIEREKPMPSPLLLSTILILLLEAPLLMTQQLFGPRARYPLSPQQLPVGVVTFLQHLHASGSILNHPNNGGYLEWMLSPPYQVYADLQAPFLFSDEDIFTALHTFTNGEVLRKVLAAYHPPFLSVPAGRKEFPKLIEPMPQYRMVFFDDEDVLYVDRSQYPDVVAQYELAALNPFQISEDDLATPLNAALHEGKADVVRHELVRMLEVAPEVRILNELAMKLYQIEGAFEQSIPYSQHMIDTSPERPEGYASKADALRELGQPAKALPLYRTALARANAPIQRRIYQALGWSYRLLGQNEAAYHAFARSITPFVSEETPYDDFYWLGSTALLTGRVHEGATLFRLAKRVALPNDPKWREWNAKMHERLSPFEQAKEDEDPVLRQAHP